MIRHCYEREFDQVWAIINDGAQLYKGAIPPDRWVEPYMSGDELRSQIEQQVVFWGYEDERGLSGVMGLQRVQDVSLIRHAYVRKNDQKQGAGSLLLKHLRGLTSTPILVGTWANAAWAIRFYQKHGFWLVSPIEKDQLLRKYWSIPERQVETSVVLADAKWRVAQG